MLWWLLACSGTEFEREQDLFRSYQQLDSISDPNERMHALLRLHMQFPDSRAILEELLLLELKGTPEQVEMGFQRLKTHLQRHPGDGIFRIHLAKYYLTLGRIPEAQQEIQLSLHNKVMHPWQLAQDDFFLDPEYRDDLESLLPLNGIQVLNLTSPERVFVSQNAIWEIEAMHHASCSLSIPNQSKQSLLRIHQLQKISNRVDDWVHNTTIQIIWKAESAGIMDVGQVNLKCGGYSWTHPISRVDVVSEELKSEQSNEMYPMFWYPEDVSTTDSGPIGVREYFNDFQTQKSSIGIVQ